VVGAPWAGAWIVASRFGPRAANPPKVNVRLDLEMG